MTPSGSLVVRHHHVVYRVYGGGAPESVASAREGSLGDDLRRTLAPAVAAISATEGYWVIRRLDVTATVGMGWTDGEVAQAVAGSIAGRLAETLRDGHDSESVLWFPDHAAFLAQFLVDMSEGRVAGRWEYDSLLPLGTSTAAVTSSLAADERDTLSAALARLAEPELFAVLAAVPPDRARRLAAELTEHDRGSSGRVGSALETALDLTARGQLPDGQPRAALMVAATAARRADATSIGGWVEPAKEVAALLSALAALPADASAMLVRTIAAGRCADALQGAGVEVTEVLVAATQWPEDTRRRLADALTDPAGEASGPAYRTPFGGMFLLLPLLEDLVPWEATTAGWPAPLGVGIAVAARWLVVCAALADGPASGVTGDPVLRLAMGVPPGIEPVDLIDWRVKVADDLVTSASAGLLRALGERLPGMADASPSYLRRNLLDFDATVTDEGRRFVVALSRPPLHVLLTLTGLAHGSLRCIGTGDKEWLLTPRS